MTMDITHASPPADAPLEKPAPLRPVGQMLTPGARCGVCNPDFRDNLDAIKHYRYASVLLKFVNAAGVLTAAAGSFKAWSAGVDESGADAGFAGNLTKAETDAGVKGAIVEQGELFKVYGLSVRCGYPTSYTSGQATQEPTHDDYVEAVQQFVMDNVNITAAFGTEKNRDRDLGTPAHWGDSTGPVGTRAAGGVVHIQGMFTPFLSGIISGAIDEPTKLVVNVTLPRAIVLNARTPAASTDLYLPLRLRLWGELACADEVEECVDQEDAKLERALRRLEKRGAITVHR